MKKVENPSGSVHCYPEHEALCDGIEQLPSICRPTPPSHCTYPRYLDPRKYPRPHASPQGRGDLDRG